MKITRMVALVISILTTGLISGFFYAYACSVTIGLALLPDSQYIAAMQAINATVRNTIFATSFFGAALALLITLGLHTAQFKSRRFWLVVAASVLYIGGGLVLTLLINVPMNEQLATVTNVSSAAIAEARTNYEAAWNFWNWVRTVCSTLAFLTLVLACFDGLQLAHRPKANLQLAA